MNKGRKWRVAVACAVPFHQRALTWPYRLVGAAAFQNLEGVGMCASICQKHLR